MTTKDPRYEPKLREEAVRAYMKGGSVRRGAEVMGVSATWLYRLLTQTKEGRAALRKNRRAR